MIISGGLIQNFLTMFMAHYLLSGAKRAGIPVLIPDNHFVWKALEQGTPIPDSPHLRTLVQGYPRRTFRETVRRRLDGLRRMFSPSPPPQKVKSAPTPNLLANPPIRIHLASPSRRILKNSVVTLHRGGIHRVHAQHTAQKVVYIPAAVWFRDASPVGPRPGALSTALLRQVMDLAGEAFELGGDSMPEVCAQWLETQALRSTSLVTAYITALRQRPLPATLWSGSGGNVWERMLRLAVNEKDGETIGHDHAGGLGYLVWPDLALSEAFRCQRVGTYRAAQEGGFRKAMTGTNLYEDEPPAITSLESLGERPVPWTPPEQAELVRRRVMYVGGIYRNDWCINMLPISALGMIDFEARVLGKLAEWGFHPIHQTHPETPSPAPADYATRIGAELVSQPFALAQAEADILLFRSPRSTTFNLAVTTQKPIVLFLFDDEPPVEPLALAALGHRCAVISVGYDAQNRAVVDWSDFRAALEKAPALAENSGFAGEYFYTPLLV
ncbi:MAG: hypothetical protein AB7D51_06745 [Desulfovibrionaceae bacterium]